MPKTTQSTEYAAQLAAADKFSARINDSRNTGGYVQFASIIVPFDGTPMATNDVINLIRLPAGAFVMPELSSIIVTGDITTGALQVYVGDILNFSRYSLTVDVADRGVKPFIAAAATNFPDGLATRRKVDDTGVPATDTSLIQMTMGGATTSPGSLTVLLAYKCL